MYQDCPCFAAVSRRSATPAESLRFPMSRASVVTSPPKRLSTMLRFRWAGEGFRFHKSVRRSKGQSAVGPHNARGWTWSERPAPVEFVIFSRSSPAQQFGSITTWQCVWRCAGMFAVTRGRAVLVSLEIGKGGGRFSPASRDGTEGNGGLQSAFAIPRRGRTLVRKIP